MNTNKIVGVVDPTANQDAATKKYVDDKNVGSFPTLFTAGSVIFSNGTNLVQNNSNFFWDNVNKRLGIGKSIPTATLDVDGSITAKSPGSGSPALNFKSTADIITVQIGSWFQDNAALALRDSGGNLKVLLRSDAVSYLIGGRVVVGKTTADHQFEVYENRPGNYVVKFHNDGNVSNRRVLILQGGADDGSGTTEFLTARDGDGSDTGYLRTVAGVFALYDLSDEQLKQDIKNADIQGLDVISKIKVRSFRFKKLPEVEHVGFVAQEVQEILSNAVSENDQGLLSVARSEFIPYLVKAIQGLWEQVKILQGGGVI